ncbi:unnamed protein product [Kuraishia capsulata CBS 1993]|uniref:Uncharacterized protein n=1 Tax=Kuraishia capsulata CBS 1993 TaxID=1382522 RepID=W6MNJ9_9ASCO|nr:uncharacterized protein KUCA_T00004183001 [Kuraishia capsulata CBS 1993]CDK28201.1 unnamed protein product [Kuraishia capsulata CBS 1993]
MPHLWLRNDALAGLAGQASIAKRPIKRPVPCNFEPARTLKMGRRKGYQQPLTVSEILKGIPRLGAIAICVFSY